MHAGISADGEALGLGLFNSFNPNYFVKAAIQYKNDTDLRTRPAISRASGRSGC